jgi:uncharacterized membrane protein YgdD (TMEM256/DUF423 family)
LKSFIALGAVLAFVAVAAGAFGAHALATRLTPDRLAVYETAARYQMYHALAIVAVGLAALHWSSSLLSAAGWAFAVGVLVFCGTLYAIAFGAPRWLGAVTPLGGLAFLAGWALLVAAALSDPRSTGIR